MAADRHGPPSQRSTPCPWHLVFSNDPFVISSCLELCSVLIYQLTWLNKSISVIFKDKKYWHFLDMSHWIDCLSRPSVLTVFASNWISLPILHLSSWTSKEKTMCLWRRPLMHGTHSCTTCCCRVSTISSSRVPHIWDIDMAVQGRGKPVGSRITLMNKYRL